MYFDSFNFHTHNALAPDLEKMHFKKTMTLKCQVLLYADSTSCGHLWAKHIALGICVQKGIAPNIRRFIGQFLSCIK